MPDFSLELEALAAGAADDFVCGVDEVGRGPWAGPVLAVAVILDRARLPAALAMSIDDSKRLPAPRRRLIADTLPAFAHIGFGFGSVDEIDRLNILQASMLAMQRAVAALSDALGRPPAFALVDGNRQPPLPCPVRCVVHGDSRSLSIAAASIVAKVARDRLMVELGTEFPGYGFEQHMGYGTPRHRAALLRVGPCRAHRRSFAPVRNILEQLSLTAAATAAPPAHPSAPDAALDAESPVAHAARDG